MKVKSNRVKLLKIFLTVAVVAVLFAISAVTAAKAKPKMTVKNGVVYGDALSAKEKKRIVMQKKKRCV